MARLRRGRARASVAGVTRYIRIADRKLPEGCQYKMPDGTQCGSTYKTYPKANGFPVLCEPHFEETLREWARDEASTMKREVKRTPE